VAVGTAWCGDRRGGTVHGRRRRGGGQPVHARGVIRALEATPRAAGQPPLTTDAIVRFYYPLALTSVLSLITLPVITFFMSHSRQPIQSLAVLRW